MTIQDKIHWLVNWKRDLEQRDMKVKHFTLEEDETLELLIACEAKSNCATVRRAANRKQLLAMVEREVFLDGCHIKVRRSAA